MTFDEFKVGQLYRYVRRCQTTAWRTVQEAVDADPNELWFYEETGALVCTIEPNTVFLLLDKIANLSEAAVWLHCLFGDKIGWIGIYLDEFEDSIKKP